MGSRNSQYPLTSKNVVRKPLRSRGIWLATIKDRLHQGRASLDHISNHPQIGRNRQLTFLEAFDQFDALIFQLGAHGRIHIGIATRHPVASGAREQGQPAHESAANTKDMNMHLTIGFIR